MLVTFLCPSRGRPISLAKSIASIRDTATDPNCFEVLVFLDSDDPSLQEYRGTIHPKATYVIGERVGYSRLHEVIGDALVPLAKGTWFFVWSDDAYMQRPNWDATLSAMPVDCVINPKTNHDGWASGLNVFPIVPNTWVSTAGWARNGANDTWWQVIGDLLGRHHPTQEIEVLHDRSDLTGNHDDATRAGNNYDSNTFFSLDNYARMGFAAGRIHQQLLLGR